MLLAISLLISLFAVSGSVILMLEPHENWMLWPQVWLLGTPFTDFRIPGLLLFSIVGASNSWGFWNLLNEHPKQFDRAMVGGYCLLCWVVLELLLSRELYLVHASAILLGAMQILLAYQQKNRSAI